MNPENNQIASMNSGHVADRGTNATIESYLTTETGADDTTSQDDNTIRGQQEPLGPQEISGDVSSEMDEQTENASELDQQADEVIELKKPQYEENSNNQPLTEISSIEEVSVEKNENSNEDDTDDAEEAIEDQDDEIASDGEAVPKIVFKKKMIPKSRTQSIQSVLSTASLRTLNSQVNFFASAPEILAPNTKNIQSVIQVPALSSITSTKKESVEIGKQLPFSDLREADEISEQQREALEQQRLTDNALRSLTISPLIVNDDDDETADQSLNSNNTIKERRQTNDTLASSDDKEPYQPAEVDLSSFVSLTRQPKHHEPTFSTKSSVQSSISTDSNGNTASTGSNPSPSFGQALNSGFSQISPNGNQNRPSWSSTQTGQQRSSQGSQLQQFPSTLSQTNSNTSMYTNEINGVWSNLSGPLGRSESVVSNNSASNMSTSSTSTITLNIGGSSPGHRNNSTSSVSSRNKQHSEHVQQIKDPRRPMYIPAVLRTPDNSHTPKSASLHNYPLRHSHSSKSFLSNYGSSIKSATSNWKSRMNELNASHLSPSKSHWMKDESRLNCSYKNCDKMFNFFERRHHCRKCGDIFCSEHTSHYLNLNTDAQFTLGGNGVLCKVCDNCIVDYEEFVKKELGLDTNVNANNEEYATNIRGQLNGGVNIDLSDKERQGSVVGDQTVGSVPADWSWSSF